MIDIDSPSLACSPDGLVDIAGKEGLDPVTAAKTLKTFFCNAGVEGSLELKRRHDYFYQVLGMMAITGRSWCDFVVWLPQGMSVEGVHFEDLWAETKPKLLDFYQRALLPELALPRLPRGQPIREPASVDDVIVPA